MVYMMLPCLQVSIRTVLLCNALTYYKTVPTMSSLAVTKAGPGRFWEEVLISLYAWRQHSHKSLCQGFVLNLKFINIMPCLYMLPPYLVAYCCIFCGDFVRWVDPCFVLHVDFSPCSISCLILSYMRWKESSRMWQDNFSFFPVLNLSYGSLWSDQLGREFHSRQLFTTLPCKD